MVRSFSLVFPIVFCLFACDGSSNSGTDFSQNQSSAASSSAQTSSAPTYVYSGSVEATKTITSVYTGITYPYHIYLPENYLISGQTYPVIYATDGQWTFDYFSQVLDKRKKSVIMVSIEQGPPNSDQRAIDYTNQGAAKYIQFLKNEIVPLIEANYRVNSERTFIGTSYGGLLGSIILSNENVDTPYFKNYLLFDGSFWSMSDANLQDEQNRYAASKSLAIHLLLTSANAPGNEAYVNIFQSRYANRNYDGLIINRKSFNIAHNDVANPSFDWAIDLIY